MQVDRGLDELERRASGRNWLFFGARHFNSDFLYQVEWQEALQKKELHRLDLAFSRDQAERLYVQHRLRAHVLTAAGQKDFQYAFRVLPQAGIDGMEAVNEFLVAHEASPVKIKRAL